MDAPAETAVIERVKADDLAAFGLLVERYKKQAYGFAFAYVRNADDALSVSQDAFVRAWKAIGSFDPERSFRPWLLGIVRHLALALLEKRRNRREVPLEEAERESGVVFAPEPTDPLEELEARETRRLVWRAVAGLKEEFREVIVLKHFHDLSYREIAETLGIPMGTVMSRLYHARLALRENLEPVLFRR